MTAPSAWRPLSEAPHEGTIVVKRTSGRVQLATATVVTVGYDLLREANESRRRGLRAFGAILHTAMGGRIPDEVP